VSRESRTVPADESSARVSAGAPCRRIKSGAERRLAERTDEGCQRGSNAAGRQGKGLLQDPDSGMEISLVRYPAGFTTAWHTRHCAHGIFVLGGTLVTRADSYSPGSFVWFAEGMLMEHGGTTMAR
jgi:quercetin dioxygenase-like cupin family protein